MKTLTTTTNVLPRIRCAIYTRKSSEENLDMEFNSLDAQREAAESYIASQRQEGWVAIPSHYDDGGFSGATIERPALQRLLADIAIGQIDCIVVYKVDRLSRSLLDFAKIVEAFDQRGVSFVSVTQQFNTTSSMGRLTLNILLSFAQFEREIIGERIRDKIASTRRKGKYTGGWPVLGYDVDTENRRLVVNKTEAELVRHIFTRFIELGSATFLVKELNDQGYRTKSWVTRKNVLKPGLPWHKNHLYALINNPLYIGYVTHKGNRYPGEHSAIVSREIWEGVQRILAENSRVRAGRTRTKTVALLRGKIRCAACDCSMIPTFTNRRGKQYRYYLCLNASKSGYAACPTRAVSAGNIEQIVIDQLRGMFHSPEIIANTYRNAIHQQHDHLQTLHQHQKTVHVRRQELQVEMAKRTALPACGNGLAQPRDTLQGELTEVEARHVQLADEISALTRLHYTESEVAHAVSALDPIWEELFPEEQRRIVHLLVELVIVHSERAEVILCAEGLTTLVQELQEKVNE
jgi:site-specific DNA recombinase